jgi:hypothetical protein
MDIKEILSAKESEINEAHLVAYSNLLSVLYDNYLELTKLGNDFYAEQFTDNLGPAIRPRIERETRNLQS